MFVVWQDGANLNDFFAAVKLCEITQPHFQLDSVFFSEHKYVDLRVNFVTRVLCIQHKRLIPISN